MERTNGLYVFVTKANNEVLYAVNDYMFDREYSKTDDQRDAALQKANEKIYQALKDRDLFLSLIEKEEDF